MPIVQEGMTNAGEEDLLEKQHMVLIDKVLQCNTFPTFPFIKITLKIQRNLNFCPVKTDGRTCSVSRLQLQVLKEAQNELKQKSN